MSEEQKTEYNYYCPNCNEEVKSDTVECHLCGYPIAEHGVKQVKKPIKIPDLPWEALSTRGKILVFCSGRKMKKYFSFKARVLAYSISFILAIFTFIGSKIYLNYDKFAHYWDDQIYWVEKLDGTTVYLYIPDGCDLIIKKLAQEEGITENEVFKLRDTIPVEDAGLLYSVFRREWYIENGYTDNLFLNMLILTDTYNFKTEVYGSIYTTPMN